MRRDLNPNMTRLQKLESDVSELEDSVKQENLLPKLETLLANHASNVSNCVVVEIPVPNVESSGSLFQAAQDNDGEAILRLLCSDEVDIKQLNEEGDSALHVAAKAGHERPVSLLLGNIPVDFPGHFGRTALHCAVTAGHEQVVHRLLLAGANVNAKDCVGMVAIHLASSAGCLCIVELLVNHNASLDAVDKDGNSALVLAAKSKRWETVEFLLMRGASVDKYKGENNAPLYLVSEENNYSLVENVIKKTGRKEEQMKIVLEKCNDPYLVDVFEDSAPGFCRAQVGRDAMIQLAEDGEVDVLRAMLDRGADVDGLHSTWGCSCLMTAAQNGHANVVQLFLHRGAYVDLRELTTNWTALHYAASEGHVECVRLLLQAGATVDIRNNRFYTPIDAAETEGIP